MANHASAVKRHRQSLKLAEYNRWWKSRVKTASKQVIEAAGNKDKKAAETALASAMKEIGKAKTKGVIHKATASRKISRLSKLVSGIQA